MIKELVIEENRRLRREVEQLRREVARLQAELVSSSGVHPQVPSSGVRVHGT